MTKASRLIRLITLLRANRSMSVSRLSSELKTSERTIYRDIDSLSEINVPVYHDGSGYHLQDNSLLPILNLDTEEYLLLKTLLDSPTSKATAETRRLVKELANKIDAVLSSSVREARKSRKSASKLLLKESHDPAAVERWMPIICQAIREDRIIEIEYESLGRGKGMRTIEPYQVLFHGRAFYLIGFAEEHREYRMYRLDRMTGITMSKQHFFPRTDYNPEIVINGKSGLDGDCEWYEVDVRFTGRAAKVVSTGKRFEGERVTVEVDGSTRYRVRVQGLTEIGIWIAGYGTDAEVIAPTALRKHFAVLGRYYIKNYSEELSDGFEQKLLPDRNTRLAHLRSKDE